MGVLVSVANSVDNSLLGDGTIFFVSLKPAGVVQGTWVQSSNATYFLTTCFYNSSNANGDEFYYYVMLSQGTYTFQQFASKLNSSGILKVYLDSTLIATHDLYNGGGTTAVLETTGITVSAGKLYKLTFKIDGKNGASSGYQSILQGGPTFIKTA